MQSWFGAKKEREGGGGEELCSCQLDVESFDLADHIADEARDGAVSGVGARTRSGGAGGPLQRGLREWSFVSTVRLSRMMAEDIKDMSKHCYLALSFAPSL